MMKSIKDFDVKEKRILVRCDFNVPLDDRHNILDDFKIRQILPTVKYLIKNRAKTILMSHLDPKEEGFVSRNFTLEKIKDCLADHLRMIVEKTDDCIGKYALAMTKGLNEGSVLLLENLRFHKGEMNNSREFARQLSELGDIYINDAFSVCHRRHTSIVLVPKFLPRGAGFLLKKEVENLNKILKNPQRPLLAIIGGAKAETKVKFVEKISQVADLVIVNGLIKKEMLKKQIDFPGKEKIIWPESNPEALDIDDKTIKLFRERILSAKTILWNGPLGKFEDKKYKKGTLAVAKAIVDSQAFSVAGGGETVEFLNKEGLTLKFSHISTGGGAMLAYLALEKLPGVEALEQ